ncbi:MAG: hypothetical protein LBU09_04175 [Endomicrobium sp.]|jgi:O-antigen/teichoic acid export membrane protein|nr:hypothetical protein [Endomicrobium sp.]
MHPNNKRIAKNTLLLYVRTMFMMFLTLFTSRIVLSSLGFTDYGLYSVVAGVISLFSFLNGSLGAATSRYFTFELGTKNTDKLKRVFRAAFNIHFALAVIVIILCESVGLWLVNNALTIPVERLYACNVIFQFVIVSSFFSIMQLPFTAMVIAHEKMNVFAFAGITNALLQLGAAYLISISSFDKLIFYVVLQTAAIIAIYAFYHLYCRRLEGYNIGKTADKPLIKEMLSYGAWNIIGAGSDMANTAGTNILMNIFFGPALNAANAIAQQVNAAVSSFCWNFSTALNPQIVKTYAAKEMQAMKTLIFRGGKFSFFLLMIFLIPVFLETDILLKFWLKSVPDYAGIFTKLIVTSSLISSFNATISTAVKATGKIKYFQIAVGGTLLLAFPITYILYALGFNPTSAYAVVIVTAAAAVFARMVFLKKYLGIKYGQYFKNVILLSAVVFVFSLPAPYFAQKIMEEGLLRLVFVSGVSLVSGSFFIYLLGLAKNEREFVNKFIKMRIFNKG